MRAALWCGWAVLAAAAVVALFPLLHLLHDELTDDTVTASKLGRAVYEQFVDPGRFWRHEECWIERSAKINHLFRPVQHNCSFCKGLERVDRVPSLSPTDFATKYAFTGRPVVVTQEAKSWQALQLLTFDFLRTLYTEVLGEQYIDTVMEECNFFRYQTAMRSLREVFAEAPLNGTSAPWYVGWSNCESSAVKMALRRLTRRPGFLAHPSLLDGDTDWLFLGAPGPGAPMHTDAIYDPSWQAQISGFKRWDLEPPPECAHVCPRSLSTVVEPGEIVVVDTFRWFHQTTALGPNLSITVGSEYFKRGTDFDEDYVVDRWDFLDEDRTILF